MIGQRRDVGHLEMEPGNYGRWKGDWICMTPNGLKGKLALHEVIEHEDGTITATPSILVNGGPRGTWHGFLERGVWRPA